MGFCELFIIFLFFNYHQTIHYFIKAEIKKLRPLTLQQLVDKDHHFINFEIFDKIHRGKKTISIETSVFI